MASIESESFRRWQLHLQNRHVGRYALHGSHARRQFADLDIRGQANLTGLDHQVRGGPGLAQQGVAGLDFLGTECLRRVGARINRAGHHARLAG